MIIDFKISYNDRLRTKMINIWIIGFQMMHFISFGLSINLDLTRMDLSTGGGGYNTSHFS